MKTRHLALLGLAMCFVAGSGCGHVKGSGKSMQKKEFKFSGHSFGAKCFDTLGCRIEYDRMYEVDIPEGVRSPSMRQVDLDHLDGGRIAIRNFPKPAHVIWTSLDGQKHEIEIDMASIFHDEQVLHNVRDEDVEPDADVDDPAIIVVVNGREVSVYMRPFIPLKAPEVAGNPYSNFNDDLVLAYRKVI